MISEHIFYKSSTQVRYRYQYLKLVSLLVQCLFFLRDQLMANNFQELPGRTADVRCSHKQIRLDKIPGALIRCFLGARTHLAAKQRCHLRFQAVWATWHRSLHAESARCDNALTSYWHWFDCIRMPPRGSLQQEVHQTQPWPRCQLASELASWLLLHHQQQQHPLQVTGWLAPEVSPAVRASFCNFQDVCIVNLLSVLLFLLCVAGAWSPCH